MEYKNKFYVGMISTVPPRKCGIGKFNWDLFQNIRHDERIDDLGFYPIITEKMDYAPKVHKMIEREINQLRTDSWEKSLEDILEKAKFRKSHKVNSGYFIQHEYGIAGKHHDSDDNIVNLLRKLKENNLPTITIAHTLLSNPSEFKKEIMQGILEYSDKIVCLTPSAITRFKEIYNASRGKLIHIPHGVPRIEIIETQDDLKREYGFIDKKGNPRQIISNLGLLSDGKGIEYALEGFSKLREKNKEGFVYCIAGETHPEIFKKEGEKYRKHCINLAKKQGLKVTNHKSGQNTNFSKYDVVFWDKYLDDKEYLKFMKMSDIGLVTNQSKDQISSGQIAYWVGMGKPVIATESPYAKDMEDEGVGLLIKFGNSEEIYDRLNFFFNLPKEEKEELEFLAAGKGATMTWDIVGKVYTNLMESLIDYHKIA